MKFNLKFAALLTTISLITGFVNSFSSLSPERIRDLVNADRRLMGLNALSLNPDLNSAAFAHAQDMVVNHYFAHNSPVGIQPWHWIQNSGYSYAYAGENLALGYNNASELENSWMSSPSHRANILSSVYKDMGL